MCAPPFETVVDRAEGWVRGQTIAELLKKQEVKNLLQVCPWAHHATKRGNVLESPAVSAHEVSLALVLGLADAMWSGREIGILLTNNQRQHRTLHMQEDVLPCALC